MSRGLCVLAIVLLGTSFDWQPAADAAPRRRLGHVASQRPRCWRRAATARPATIPRHAPPAVADPYAWRDLFDGKTLRGWRIIDEFDFARHGKVSVADGAIRIEPGSPASGVAFAGKPPRDNYELRLHAKRTVGSDFFCGLTFPVGDSHCTLILGGWGGGVVGLSNVDHMSAVENETSTYLEFDNDRWYKIRLRVTPQRIAVWVDDEQLIDLAREDRQFSIWWEQEPARPLGIATWYTGSALRGIQLRQLKPSRPAAGEPSP